MTTKVEKAKGRIAVIRSVNEKRMLRDEIKDYSLMMGKLCALASEQVVSRPASDERKTPDCGVRRPVPGVDQLGRVAGTKKPEGRRSTDLAPEVSSDAEMLAIRIEVEEDD